MLCDHRYARTGTLQKLPQWIRSSTHTHTTFGPAFASVRRVSILHIVQYVVYVLSFFLKLNVKQHATISNFSIMVTWFFLLHGYLAILQLFQNQIFNSSFVKMSSLLPDISNIKLIHFKKCSWDHIRQNGRSSQAYCIVGHVLCWILLLYVQYASGMWFFHNWYRFLYFTQALRFPSGFPPI